MLIGCCFKLVNLDSLAAYWDSSIWDTSSNRDTIASADSMGDRVYGK